MKLLPLWIGYKDVSLTAKRLYTILFCVAKGFKFTRIARVSLAEMAGLSIPTIKRALGDLRKAELITLQQTSFPSSPVVYQLIPPDDENADYLEFIESSKKLCDVPVQKSDKQKKNGLPISNLIPRENLWLDSIRWEHNGAAVDVPLSLLTKPVTSWGANDFISFIRYLFSERYKVPCPEFEHGNMVTVGKLKNCLLSRFHKLGYPNHDCIKYVIWLFSQKWEEGVGLGLVISKAMQQRWLVIKAREETSDKQQYRVTKVECDKKNFGEKNIRCITCAEFESCSAANKEIG